MARALDVDPTTLSRQQGRGRIPGPIAAALTAWLDLRTSFGILPPVTPLGSFRHASGDPGPEVEMDPVQLIEQASVVLFGPRSRKRLAAALGLDTVSLWRQTTNGVRGPVLAAVRAWLVVHALTGRHPPSSPFPHDIQRPSSARSKYADLLRESIDAD